MEFFKRCAAEDNLDKYCHFASKGDMVGVTEWFNQEGFDFFLEFQGAVLSQSLTYGQFNALKALVEGLYEYDS